MKTITNVQKINANNNAVRKPSNLIKFLICCTVLLLTTKAMAQTTHIVNNNAGTEADFTDLQAAIDAAANGDIIHVQQSSTSYGGITLNKSLTIIGRSHSDASYKSEVGGISIADGASNSTIKGLKISFIQDGFTTTNTISDLVISDCDISSSFDIGNTENYNNVLIQGNIIRGTLGIRTNATNILITNNIFTSSSLSFSMVDTLLFTNNILGYYAGVTISNSTPDLLNISNCIFISDFFVQPVISLSGSGTFQISNCITYSYNPAFPTYNFSTGGNITLTNVQENVDPLFTFRDGSSGSGTIADPSGIQFVPGIDDLTLQAGSPVGDDGLYQGYNFKTFGTPTGLPSIKIDTYSPTVPKNGDLNVTITAKTN